MAFRATSYWRSMRMSRIGGGINGNGNSRSSSFATSTSPKMKVFAPTVDHAAEIHAVNHHGGPNPSKGGGWAAKKGEFAPVYVVLGMVLVAMSIGAHTAKQQLVHSPTVRVSKKRRESYPEVEDPDHVVASADKFVNKSFLRKVAHIQDHQRVLPDTGRPDPFTRPRRAETLKTAGVDPAIH